MSSSKVLEKGRICEDALDEIVGMALESLKTLMADYETPIEVRLQVALKIFEIFGGAWQISKILSFMVLKKMPM